MSSLTYFKSYHLYTLRQPLSGIDRVLIIAHQRYCDDNALKSLTILPVYRTSRRDASTISLKINAKVYEGAQGQPTTTLIGISGAFPMPKKNMILSSATSITVREEKDIRAALRDYLGI